MHSAMLKRLFKTISGDPESDQIKIANEIIASERKKGHAALARSLEKILTQNASDTANIGRKAEAGKLLSLHEIPFDRRYKIPLATHVERELLRHAMVLPPETEAKIARIESEYAARERLKHFGLQPRKKVLLYGPPGCGKSMTAERIAWNLGLPFLKVKFESILSSFLGESASNIKAVFDAVHSNPCVLLLDEFDYIGKKRDSMHEVGEMHRIVNVLLQLMEEYDAPGILIATTNLETSLDSALFRRFDDVIELPRPGIAEIEQLLAASLSAMELEKGMDLKQFARNLEGYSPAMIVKVAQDAAKQAVLQQDLPVRIDHLHNALSENRERGS